MALTHFVDRVPQQPNRKKIVFETDSIDVTGGNYATIEYADNPLTVGTPLSADNLNKLVDEINFLGNKEASLLFEGAIKTGNITLSENIYNYTFLVFSISAETSNAPYGYAAMPIIRNRKDTYQIFQGTGALSSNPNQYSTYVGGVVPTSDNVFQISKPVMNVIHTSGSTHGGGTTYYIREVWGIK